VKARRTLRGTVRKKESRHSDEKSLFALFVSADSSSAQEVPCKKKAVNRRKPRGVRVFCVGHTSSFGEVHHHREVVLFPVSTVQVGGVVWGLTGGEPGRACVEKKKFVHQTKLNRLSGTEGADRRKETDGAGEEKPAAGGERRVCIRRKDADILGKRGGSRVSSTRKGILGES